MTSTAVVVVLLLGIASGSHFRGAHFWWAPLAGDGDEVQVEINVRISWHLDYSENTHCSDDVIASGELIGPINGGHIKCVSANCVNSTNAMIGSVRFRCADFSEREEWVSGLVTHIHTFPPNDVYQIRWRGESWRESVLHNRFDTDWVFLCTVDLRTRPDTQRINHSPVTAMKPELRVQHGCAETLQIPVFDMDGDDIQCRWALESESTLDDECGSICGALPGFVLQPDSCVLQIASTTPAGPYALALQIEDFLPDNTSYGALSSVPLQFMIEVHGQAEGSDVADDGLCGRRPQFIYPTPTDRSCVLTAEFYGEPMTIAARTADELTSIVEINTVSSLGMRKSAITRLGEDLRDYAVSITWAADGEYPEPEQAVVCFIALDSAGLSSEQLCIFVISQSLGPITPHPRSVWFSHDDNTVYIEYNRQVSLGPSDKEISVFNAIDDSMVVNLMTSQVLLINNTLAIDLPVQLSGQFYILMEQGVVQASPPCGSESNSAAVTDKQALVVSTAVTITPEAARSHGDDDDDDDDDFHLWLIAVIVVAAILFILLLIIAAIIVRRKRHSGSSDTSSIEVRTDDVTALQSPSTQIVGYDGPYAPNFHDIEVKFR